MFYVLLVYGLAFLAAAVVLVLHARAPAPVLPRRCLGMLAAFAFLHGVADWMRMVELVEVDGFDGPRGTVIRFGGLILGALSSAALLQAGLDLLVTIGRLPAWAKAVPLAALAVTAALVMLGAVTFPPAQLVLVGDAAYRYALLLPASIAAAAGLFAASSTFRAPGTGDVPRYLRWLAWAFVAYGVFAGLVVAAAPFPPASWLNTETFFKTVHVRVEFLRTACAVVIAWLFAEAFVVQTARGLRELERLREEFISLVAHDLRGPLTLIRLNAARLKRLLPAADPSETPSQLIGSIDTSVAGLDRMVTDLLDASRIEAKRLTVNPEFVNASEMVASLAETMSATTGRCIRAVVPAKVIPVLADPVRLEQILVNLLSNAVKYSTPESEIVLEIAERGGQVVVGITNAGSLDPADVGRLFTRFYRTPSAERSHAQGLGLGLYIAKGLVEAHGGRIDVDVKPGATTFVFTLPRAQAARLESTDTGR